MAEAEVGAEAKEAEKAGPPHHQILRKHRQYTLPQYLLLQEVLPLLEQTKAIPKSVRREIKKDPKDSDGNLNFLLAYLREAKVEKFVRFIEALGESTKTLKVKSHITLIEAMSDDLEHISNADPEQVERVKKVVRTLHEPPPEQASPTERMVNELYPGFVEPQIAEVFSRKNLANGDGEWILHSPAHGVRIGISGDAVPPEIDKFAVKVRAYLNGSFEIPKEYEVCTAIFTIRMDPEFKFLKPVTLRIPHSALFDEDDDPDDFVVLRAPDPDTPIRGDTHTPIPPIYQFTDDVISNADFSSSNYYIQIDLEHFCAVVGAKKKHKYRRPKSSLPLTSSLSRQGSHGTQRKSRKGRGMKKRIKVLERGSSIGSSRQSSYEASFETDEKSASLTHQRSPLVGQSSSAESDGPFRIPMLQRQVAMQHDDGYSSTPSPLLQQQSSSVEDGTDVNCNEICICCCSPEHRTDKWMTQFIIAPNHPTGRMALHNVVKTTKRRSGVDVDVKQLVATPYSQVIDFEPDKWENSDWAVTANSTPQISLDLVTGVGDDLDLWQPPHVDFDAEITSPQHCYSSLHHVINVTGAEANGKQIYFSIKSTGSSSPSSAVVRRTDVIHTQSWLYQEDSNVLQALNNACSINLSLCPDHCKLIADIALQMPSEHYEHLLREFGISEAVQGQLETSEQRNLPERMYKVFIAWINSLNHKATLGELKSVLRKVGIRDIRLCSSEIQLLSSYPDLYDKVCDRQLCITLAVILGTQWRFVGRYLGLPNADFDDLLDKADREGLKEAAYCMLDQWQKQCGREASVAALLKAIYRVYQLSPSFATEPWWLLEEKIIHEILENDG